MKSPIKMGSSIFRTVREKGYHYVDKSALISEILEREEVLLLPRPRRFGKTLNLTMLHTFFDDTQASGPLFEGLAVTKNPAAMDHLNAYPTVFLSFKDMAHQNWPKCERALQARISTLIGQHQSRIWPVANDIQKIMLQRLHAQEGDLSDCEQALLLLTQLLCQATGKKVVVLIDEYDNPVHEGHTYGYLTEILSFMRNFLGSALKDNPCLERGMISGILRITKESIFSGLNNLRVYSILEPEFATCFGFTEAEVHQILVSQGLAHREAEVRAWYNGYRFGGQTIYNPWSILTMASNPKAVLQDYWLNTSGNGLIQTLILSGKACNLNEIETLLKGLSVRKKIDPNVAIRDLAPESAWSLFLFSGYLTAENYDPLTKWVDLFIPNYEVRRFFEETVLQWLGPPSLPTELIDHLMAGEIAAFAACLAKSVSSILSYHDTAKKHPEQIYHVFVIGLLAQLTSRFNLYSNRESGLGRPDLALLPQAPGDPGFIFEFKTAASAQSNALTTAAHAALNQAFERDYAADFRQKGVTRLTTLGVAFFGKRLALAYTTQDLPNGQPSEVQLYLEGPAPLKPKRNPATTTQRNQPRPKPSKQTIQDALKIQRLQKQQGFPITAYEYLLETDPEVLKSIIQGLLDQA